MPRLPPKPKRATWGSKPRIAWHTKSSVMMPEDASNPLARPPPIVDRIGRPPKYRPEYADIACKLVDTMGATDQQLADFFDVGAYTVWRWKLRYPEFRVAVELTPERANKIMERSLFLRGTGYSHPAVKIFLPAGAKEPVLVRYTEYYPPDTGAAALWLHNRDPKRWKNRGNAPPEDPPLPGAAQEADRKRKEGFATMMAIIEDRIKQGLPPIFAKPQGQIIDQVPRPEGALSHKGNGKGNGKP